VEYFPIEQVRDWGAECAIILGSGLNSLIAEPDRARTIPYSDVLDLPRSNVPGHAGRFVLAEINGRKVVFAQGRAHLYEGHSAQVVTAGVRFLGRAGLKQLIVTNAAGSANPEFAPGSWMMITDQLNLTGTSPLVGRAEFIDMTVAYSARLRERFAGVARSIGLELREGVYAGLLGPQYETPAEVRMLRALGADAVGMSTVLEVIQARALGLEVAGFSCLTNWGAGLSGAALSHEEVLEMGRAAAKDFGRLLDACFS
jgi:purine-nucleoside phosphorylase